ncbi:MAG: ABC transporter [Phenylobacterium zucineum]|nr:MAG: ABC transporter [Phenylobacterium zucineum]
MNGLSARDVTVSLGGAMVLHGVDLALEPGVVTAIVGPNGAGKSTLMEVLAGLRGPKSGAALLDAAPVLSLPARQRAKRIAYLPQTPEIAWAVTVRTFVGLGRTAHTGPWGLGREDLAAVEAAMSAAGVSGFADRVVTTLSGGERARVFVARALAGEPSWLLADEPLAGLDPGHVLDTLALFRELAGQGAGVVLTLHDLSLAARTADRIVVLAAGRIVADGAPETCLAPETLRAAYGVDAVLVRGAEGPLIEVLRRAG